MSETFFTTGGLGDAWIQMLKILNICEKEFIWHHITGQAIHVTPISELQSLVTKHYNCKQVKRGDVQRYAAKFLQKHPGTIRVSSKTQDKDMPIITPKLDFIGQGRIMPQDYIVIQPIAGRPNDNSKRYISRDALKNIVKQLSKTTIVLLGARFDFIAPNVINLTNNTNIYGAINIIYNAQTFIGYHGFLSYVSMSTDKKTYILFDDPRLLDHYMNEQWKKNSTIIPVNKYIEGPTILNDANAILRRMT